MKLSTAIWLALIAAMIAGVYHLKYEVIALEKRLETMRDETQRDREAIHVLHAEWSFLNQPQRLRALADKHLKLQPLAQQQVMSLGEVPGSFAVQAAEKLDAKPAASQPQPARTR
ncbi:MAG: hypothetical protein AB7G15_00370 [Alphaproteobacteria bacterium]